MVVKTNSLHPKLAFFALTFFMLLVPFHTTFVQGAEGVSIEKDVLLEWPIQGIEDLPNEVTFSLYDSENAIVPLATQSFSRGKYVLDFEFNKSDGVASGSIARFKVAFTNKLDLGTASDESKHPKEIWAEFSMNNTVVGDRKKVSDDAMVQLLLASDASIATYLTLAYQGDENPITTIYKDLPLSSASGTSSNDYITSLFSVYSPTDASVNGLSGSQDWFASGNNIYYAYNGGFVGIGTTDPKAPIDFGTSSTPGRPYWLMYNDNVGINMGIWRDTPGPNDSAFVLNYAGAFILGKSTSAATPTFGTEWMRITTDGNVGIGTATPSYKLAVNGTIGCKELTVTSTGWADFVFEKNYRLPPLTEVETFISENKHLPGIPSEADVKKNGISVGDMNSKLLQKIEELTLYMIDLKKENDSLKAKLDGIQEELGKQHD
ncbi:MAG: hypothetical protein HN354_11120 [Deltaproteobacteria bacterium]|nr:hypothetical protein [Deltaproteobacteria bacterium]